MSEGTRAWRWERSRPHAVSMLEQGMPSLGQGEGGKERSQHEQRPRAAASRLQASLALSVLITQTPGTGPRKVDASREGHSEAPFPC